MRAQEWTKKRKDSEVTTEIRFPEKTRLIGKETGSFYRDAFVVRTTKPDLDSKQVYHAIFGYLPKPVQGLLKIRNSIVKWLGFKASDTGMSLPLKEMSEGRQAGFLTIEMVSDAEVICAAYEKHMDMWLSVMRLSEHEYALSTLVNLKTTSGRIYMTVIKPFHKMVVTYSIRQALKAGRI